MILSMMSWGVGKEKGFVAVAVELSSAVVSSSSGMMRPEIRGVASLGEASFFETSIAETLHERARNSMGSQGISGGRSPPPADGERLPLRNGLLAPSIVR